MTDSNEGARGEFLIGMSIRVKTRESVRVTKLRIYC